MLDGDGERSLRRAGVSRLEDVRESFEYLDEEVIRQKKEAWPGNGLRKLENG